jgi:two-component system response regulator
MQRDKILLVEDNEDDVELTLLALKKSHIANEVVVARDGAAALDYLLGSGSDAGKAPDLPAVVILDLNLPKVTGIEVLKQMRKEPRTALVPVVVLTTSAEEADILASYRHGCNAYVRKPVSFDEFLDAAGKLGLFWLTVNVQAPATA